MYTIFSPPHGTKISMALCLSTGGTWLERCSSRQGRPPATLWYPVSCKHKYDCDSRPQVPHVLPACGHTICAGCIVSSRGDQIVSLIRIFSSFKEKDRCALCYIFSNVARHQHNHDYCRVDAIIRQVLGRRCCGCSAAQGQHPSAFRRARVMWS